MNFVSHFIPEMNPQNNNSCPLGDDLFAVVSVYRARIGVHIRTYTRYLDGGRFFPTKDGVCLTRYEWLQFVDMYRRVDLVVQRGPERVTWHVSPNLKMYIATDNRLQRKIVLFKDYKEGSKASVTLMTHQWQKLYEHFSDIDSCISEYLWGDRDLAFRESIAEERDRQIGPNPLYIDGNLSELDDNLFQLIRREMVRRLLQKQTLIDESEEDRLRLAEMEDKERLVTLYFDRSDITRLDGETIASVFITNLKTCGLLNSLDNNFVKDISFQDYLKRVKDDLLTQSDWFCVPYHMMHPGETGPETGEEIKD